MDYLFIFGNTPQLSRLELLTVLSAEHVSARFLLENQFGAVVQTNHPLEKIFTLLGGSIKLAMVINSELSLSEGLTLISEHLKMQPSPTFGLSFYGQDKPYKFLVSAALEIKDNLKQNGIRSRYVLPRHGLALSSVVIAKQKVIELILFSKDTNGKLLLARTIGLFDFEDWSKRDYDRPEVAPKLGMLPPRVARMMVNIGASSKELGASFRLLDPFCGVGTIVLEAFLRGATPIANDIVPQQIEKTKKNYEWLGSQYKLEGKNGKFLIHPAQSLSKVLESSSVNSIVTEPDLGSYPPKLEEGLSLEALYVACFADWREILVKEGKVVIALPSFSLRHGSDKVRVSSDLVKNVIDKVTSMGYSLLAGPIEYARDQAQVRRNICVFELRIEK